MDFCLPGKMGLGPIYFYAKQVLAGGERWQLLQNVWRLAFVKTDDCETLKILNVKTEDFKTA